MLGAPVEAASDDVPLIEAVRAQDLARVRALVRQRADVNAPQGDGATALHWAVHLDDAELPSSCCWAPARGPARPTTPGATPLFLACTNRSGAMVARLLRAGADANAALTSGETVLMTCARTGEAAACRRCSRRGARADTQRAGASSRRR